MVWCEAIIAYHATVNAATATLAVLTPTSLTTRSGYGKPKVTHFMALTSTNDVARVWCVPSGYADSNGFDAPLVAAYGATAGFDLKKAQLPVPIEIPENTALTIYAQSETAANTVVFAWLWLEYPSKGAFIDCPSNGAMTQRPWEHGAALTSVVAANSTDITTLQAGRKYWPSAIGKAAVDGETAGIVGPAFAKFRNVEFEGAECWIPLANNNSYIAAGGISGINSFKRCGIKMPIVSGGTPFQTSCVGYTAEQPQGVVEFVVDKLFA